MQSPTFTCLVLAADLEDIKFQIVGLVGRPEDGVVGGLGTELDLAEAFMGVFCGLGDHLGKKLAGHEVGTGAGGKIAAVFYQPHGALVDFPVALGGVFDRVFGFGEGGRVEDDDVEPLSLPLQLGQELEDVGAFEAGLVLKAVQGGVFGGLLYAQLGGVHA